MYNSKSESDFVKLPTFNGLIPQMKLSLVLNQRKIYLYDDICENSIFECMYYLNKLKYTDLMSNTKEPIEILINSNGGIVDDGFSLISLIEQMKEDGYEIITTNIGRAFSMGFLISLSGSKRQAYRYSRYMFHDVSSCAYGKAQEIKERIEDIEMSQKQLINYILNNSNIPVELLNTVIERKIDKFFTPNELLELKGVDIIL